jgi:flagellar biogenesis protein FliO
MGTARKKIGLLCLLLIVSGGWIALASRQGVAAGQKTKDRAVDGAPSTTLRDSSSFLSDPNLPSAPSLSLGHGDLFLRMMLSVGLVIGLGAVALYVSKRALPRVVHPGGKEIHVLETTYLGPRKALHLFEVGGQRLLIASTGDSVTMLTPINEAWPDLPKSELGEAVKA